MPNFDRGMIKWAPFNSVISGKEIVHNIQQERNAIKMPILSEEQKQINETKIVEYYYEQRTVQIKYVYANKLFQEEGIIKKIDPIFHKIYFNNHILVFEQIIDL